MRQKKCIQSRKWKKNDNSKGIYIWILTRKNQFFHKNQNKGSVEKKNPLTEPPDINELPVPLDQEEENSEISNDDSLDIEKALNSEQSKDLNNNENNGETSLEKTIIEKINN